VALLSYEHDDVKNFIVKLLNYYGVAARSEVRVVDRVLDIVGHYGDRKLCIEVSKSSDLAKDLDSLKRAGCDLKFIVWLKPYEKPDRIEDVWITSPEEFESLLRLLLNVPLSKPRYPEALLTPQLEITGKDPLAELTEFEKFIVEELGLPNLLEPVEEFLLKVYALYKVKTEHVIIPYGSTEMSVTSFEDPQNREFIGSVGAY